ncbi:MAG: flagellar basal body P-ring formation chaperone FlgA [Spirochaetota bacterium]
MRRLCLIIILTIIPAYVFALTLTLRQHISVSGDVRLLDAFHSDGDIANPVLMPRPTTTTTVTLAFLLAQVNRELSGIDLDAVGSRIVISPGASRASGSETPPAAASAAPRSISTGTDMPTRDDANTTDTDPWRAFVADKLLDAIVPGGAKKSEFRVKFLYKLPVITMRNDNTLSFVFGQGKMVGTQRIRVDVLSRDGKRENWFETLVEVYTVKTVLTAKAYIDKNTAMTSDLCEAREYRSDRIPADSVTDAAELANRMTKYYIKRDNIVRRFHLADTIAVHKGDTVDVHMNDGAIMLSVKATALADAGENMRVKLMNPTTKREFAGIVRKGIVYVSR